MKNDINVATRDGQDLCGGELRRDERLLAANGRIAGRDDDRDIAGRQAPA